MSGLYYTRVRPKNLRLLPPNLSIGFVPNQIFSDIPTLSNFDLSVTSINKLL